MYQIYFRAVLKTQDGNFIEKGYASVSQVNNSVDFKNEFVPLMKMGTPVNIYRVMNGKEVQCFSGNVYLSSRSLLRITDVSDRVIENERKLFGVNADIPVEFTLKYEKTDLFKRIKKGKTKKVYGTIYSVSKDRIKFSSKDEIEKGQRLVFNLPSPVDIKKISIQVYEKIIFGTTTTGYHCEIIAMPENEIIIYQNFISETTKQNRQIFAQMHDNPLNNQIHEQTHTNL